jgi:hypothetical protein
MEAILSDGLLDHHEALEILEPNLAAIARCPEHAWRQWERLRSTDAKIFTPLSRRTRACFIYDHTIAQAQREFPGLNGGPRIVDGRGGLNLLEIHPRLRLRFKRMRPNLTTRAIMTAQQMQIHLQLPIPGLAPATTATVGYVTNITETGVERKVVVCRLDAAVHWVIELPDVLSGEEPESIVRPEPPREPRIGPAEGTIEIAIDETSGEER